MYPYLLQLKESTYYDISSSITSMIGKRYIQSSKCDNEIETASYEESIFSPTSKSIFNSNDVSKRLAANVLDTTPYNNMPNFIDCLRTCCREVQNEAVNNLITHKMKSHSKSLKNLPFNEIPKCSNLFLPKIEFETQRLLNNNYQNINKSVILENYLTVIQNQLLISNLKSAEDCWFQFLNFNLKMNKQNIQNNLPSFL